MRQSKHLVSQSKRLGLIKALILTRQQDFKFEVKLKGGAYIGRFRARQIPDLILQILSDSETRFLTSLVTIATKLFTISWAGAGWRLLRF